MKTHAGARSKGSSLPPPPAPTARDANPWPMPEQHGDRRAGTRNGGRSSPQAPAPVAPEPRAPQSGLPAPHRRRVGGFPLLILAGALIVAIIAARDAIAAGDYAGAAGPIAIAIFVAFSAWQRFRHR